MLANRHAVAPPCAALDPLAGPWVHHQSHVRTPTGQEKGCSQYLEPHVADGSGARISPADDNSQVFSGRGKRVNLGLSGRRRRKAGIYPESC
jgi:hypothetical protein